MDVVFLLIFLAFLFVMVIGGSLYWAIMSGQFDNTEENASAILHDDNTEESASVILHHENTEKPLPSADSTPASARLPSREKQ